MVDTPFDTYRFAATGGSALRTMPERLHDVINVLEYGADPTGVVDSTTTCQAAITAASTSGVIAAGHTGGIAFFPPGKYQVNGTLTGGAANTTVQLIGSGKDATLITGTNNSSYLISPHTGLINEITLLSNMTVANLSATPGSGGAYMAILGVGKIENCKFSGYVGLDASNNTYSTLISGCDFVGNGVSGSVGLQAGQNSVIGCRFTNWDKGLAVFNIGFFLGNAQFSSCGTAISLGDAPVGFLDSLDGFALCGVNITNCDTGIRFTASGGGFVGGVVISGSAGKFNTKPQYGLYVDSGSTIVFEGCSVTAQCDQSGVYLNAYGASFNNVTSVVSPGIGSNWRLDPTNPFGWQFTNCNNQANIGTRAPLGTASSANEGLIFDISDAIIASDGPGGGQWGGTVTGSGTTHARIRSNGTRWTAVGI